LIGVFFQSLLIGYSGSLMPGPLLTYTINQSIKVGVRAGVLIILGHALLELATVVVLFLGLGTFLSTNIAQIIIGIAGGIVLILFGASMVRVVIQGKAKMDMEGKWSH
jgi:threonine/homoserine/homoserine lactone efflux protein